MNLPADPDAHGWSITRHVCAVCQGRMLQRGEELRCSGCDRRARGKVSALCGCGMRVGKDRPFICMPNPRKSAADPVEIVIGYRPEKSEIPRNV